MEGKDRAEGGREGAGKVLRATFFQTQTDKRMRWIRVEQGGEPERIRFKLQRAT